MATASQLSAQLVDMNTLLSQWQQYYSTSASSITLAPIETQMVAIAGMYSSTLSKTVAAQQIARGNFETMRNNYDKSNSMWMAMNNQVVACNGAILAAFNTAIKAMEEALKAMPPDKAQPGVSSGSDMKKWLTYGGIGAAVLLGIVYLAPKLSK